MKRSLVLTAILSLVLAAPPCWDDHDQITWLAIADQAYALDPVAAEELSSFLEAEKQGLADALAGVEARMRELLPGYPELPSALAFDPGLAGDALVSSFIGAIRVNPERAFILFLQPLAGEAAEGLAGDPLPASAVDLFEYRFPNPPFRSLSAGAAVPAGRVIAAASDEPDYGMDLGLYQDNGTAWGSAYGLGSQPFGNPALVYGSQAPLHMSFPWEDPVIKLAAGFVGRGLSAYRVELYTALARFALSAGHEYWGYRFAGWALHYIEDLAQPYHARLMPGKDTLGMLALYALGSAEDIDGTVRLLSNRHLVIEDYAYRAVWSDPVLAAGLASALAGGPPAPPYREGWAYDLVAWTAYGRGRSLDRLIVRAFPEGLVADPSYDYGADPARPDALALLKSGSPDDSARVRESIEGVFSDLGGYVRAYLEYIRDPGATAGPRRAPFDPRAFLYLAGLVLVLGGLAALLARGIRRRRAARASAA